MADERGYWTVDESGRYVWVSRPTSFVRAWLIRSFKIFLVLLVLLILYWLLPFPIVSSWGLCSMRRLCGVSWYGKARDMCSRRRGFSAVMESAGSERWSVGTRSRRRCAEMSYGTVWKRRCV